MSKSKTVTLRLWQSYPWYKLKQSHKWYQIIATHYSDIALEGWSTSKVSCPVRICTICISGTVHASNFKKMLSGKLQANRLHDIQTLNSREKIITLDWPGLICSIFCISIHGWGRVQSIDTSILEAPDQPN